MSGQTPPSLSVNLNKIALIRNSRPGNNPNLIDYAKKCVAFGAQGITVHPRPDQRHIRPEDCHQLKQLVSELQHAHPALELNLEGNPFSAALAAQRPDHSDYPGFLALLEAVAPAQATLVPDADGQLTSDHGFNLKGDNKKLKAAIAEIKQIGCRVSLFMDPDCEQISYAADIGADRIELYTGPYAIAYGANKHAESVLTSSADLFKQHCLAAEHAHHLGLGINAGHDLNLDNLTEYKNLPHLLEVSIGHALTIDTLKYGLEATLSRYRSALK